MSQLVGSAVAGLKPCKRYIVTHDESGKSIYAESPEQIFNAVPNFGGCARSFSIGSVPASLTNDEDIKAYRAASGPTSYTRPEIVVPQPGANLLVIDLEPGGISAMHRTVSIDFSICVIGEIDHELDGGEKVRLYPGVSCHCLCQRKTVPANAVVGSHCAARDKPSLVEPIKDSASEVRGDYNTLCALRYRW